MFEPKISPFTALRFRDFRLFWIVLLISQLALQMQLVGINLHIYHLTRSAVNLGLLGLAGFLPILLFSLVGGTVADKYNRKKVMVISQIVLSFSSLLLMHATINNYISPLLIYFMVAINATVVTFDLPARQSVVPSLVPKQFLVNAVSLNTLMRQTALTVGPPIAGFLIDFKGFHSIYAITSLSLLLSTLIIVFVNIPKRTALNEVTISLSSALEGIRFIKKSPIILSTMILDFLATFFSSATLLIPIFAYDILGAGGKGAGFLYGASSVGAIIAGLVMSSIASLKKQGMIILSAIIVYGLATIGFGLSKTFAFAYFFLFLVGAADMVSTIIRNTIRQILTPDYLRGRMVSINMIFFVGGPQLGEFEAGLLAAAIGAPASVVVGGVATIIITAIVAIAIPKLRRYQGNEVTV